MMLEMVTSVQEWNPSRQAIETHILMDNRQWIKHSFLSKQAMKPANGQWNPYLKQTSNKTHIILMATDNAL
jgi:hypothetical protein